MERTTKAAPGMARQVLFAVLAAALAVLALRPFCDLAFAGVGRGDCARLWAAAGQHAAEQPDPASDSTGECRVSINDANLVNPAEPLIPWVPDVPLGAALFILAGLPLFASSRNAVRFRLAVPPERPFYARSARILR